MSVTVDLDDATAYLRELLVMNREQLLQVANFVHMNDKIKKTEMMAYVFEKHFNSNAIDPTIMVNTRSDPYGKARPIPT